MTGEIKKWSVITGHQSLIADTSPDKKVNEILP